GAVMEELEHLGLADRRVVHEPSCVTVGHGVEGLDLVRQPGIQEPGEYLAVDTAGAQPVPRLQRAVGHGVARRRRHHDLVNGHQRVAVTTLAAGGTDSVSTALKPAWRNRNAR